MNPLLIPAFTATAWAIVLLWLYWNQIKLVRWCSFDEASPSWYGLVYYDGCRRRVRLAIIPLNYPLRAARIVWIKSIMTWPLPKETKSEIEFARRHRFAPNDRM